jgi:hypothetical protein
MCRSHLLVVSMCCQSLVVPAARLVIAFLGWLPGRLFDGGTGDIFTVTCPVCHGIARDLFTVT